MQKVRHKEDRLDDALKSLLICSAVLSCTDISSSYVRTDNQTWLARSQGNPAHNLEAERKRAKRLRISQMEASESVQEEVMTSEEDDEDEDGDVEEENKVCIR
jgi:hypothetical protein